jgi:lipoyl(octanoyl) transferase
MVSAPPLRWTWLGRTRYRPTWELQEEARRRIQAGDDDAERLYFCEHEPVLTSGRHADPAHVLADAGTLERLGVERCATSRGGDVTAHGPGQLVIYPVVRLRHGVVAHVGAVGGAIAEELAARGVPEARCARDPVGVFVGRAKVAACGVHVSRRVTIHGWALNVTRAPLALFRLIVPCGLADTPVTCMEDLGVAPAPDLEALAAALAPRIAARMGREARFTPCDPRLAR